MTKLDAVILNTLTEILLVKQYTSISLHATTVKVISCVREFTQVVNHFHNATNGDSIIIEVIDGVTCVQQQQQREINSFCISIIYT